LTFSLDDALRKIDVVGAIAPEAVVIFQAIADRIELLMAAGACGRRTVLLVAVEFARAGGHRWLHIGVDVGRRAANRFTEEILADEQAALGRTGIREFCRRRKKATLREDAFAAARSIGHPAAPARRSGQVVVQRQLSVDVGLVRPEEIEPWSSLVEDYALDE